MLNNTNLTPILQQEDSPEGGYWGNQGAGAIFFAKNTKRFLFGLRSKHVNESGTWGGFGGKIETGEDPKEALIRELKEEIGYLAPMELQLVYVYKDEDFRYYNYIAIVDEEFEPDLNYENDAFLWVKFGHWPEPLHFGAEVMLHNSKDKILKLIDSNVKEVTLTAADLTPVTRYIHPASIVHQQSPQHISPNFINYIKSVENAQGIGYKDGKWFPHKSPEGGLPTIGYGHKIKDKHELEKYNKGVSDSEITTLLKHDLEVAKERVYKDIKSMFNVNIPLSEKQEQILIDYAFNLGSLHGFPKLTRAVLNKDWDTVKQEYKRSFHTASGEKKELQRRNLLFAKNFLFENNMESKNSSTLHSLGLIDDGVNGYSLKSEHSWINFGVDVNNIFIIYVIETAKDAQNQGHASKLLDTFFQMVKRKNGSIDVGPYTTSGEMYIKPVIEKLAQKYRVRIVK